MKLKKKSAVILSFVVGIVMFTSTAIAGVVSKSGYDELKHSVKYTAESCTTKLQNYTMDMSFIIKDNGKIISSENHLYKVDLSKQANEIIVTIPTMLDESITEVEYSYSDKNVSISKNTNEDMYYLTEYASSHKNNSFKNPFKEKEAGDMEKIVDALVGSLKDAVVVKQNADGGKNLSGSISESQIPAVVNAVSSYGFKNQFGNTVNRVNNESSKIPKIAKDVYVKEVKGNMVTTKEGLIQNVLGTGVISGKEENGKEHKLTFEVLVKISDVNSTKVTKPDLSGKKVQKHTEKDYNKLSNTEKYIGKYKTDIIIEKDGKFEKIGEKIIDINAVNDKAASGRYYEEYVKGYESYGKNKKDFKFDAKLDKDTNGSFTSSSSNDSIKGYIRINYNSAKIYFGIDGNRRENILNDDEYSRIFN